MLASGLWQIHGAGGLTEAGGPLSTARLPQVAAAIPEMSELEPVVPEEQPDFGGPGLRTGQIGEKGPGAGTGFLMLAHS